MDTIRLFNNTAVGASLSTTSRKISMAGRSKDCSLQVALTGSGKVRVWPVYSDDGQTFMRPTGVPDIITNHKRTSGPGADGKEIVEFTAQNARFMKITGQEHGATASIWLTADLTVR